MTRLHYRDLGLQDYLPVWHAMRDYTQQRHAESQDELWLLQHPPVFTLGQAGKPEHLLAPGDIPVVATDRGGQVTYHGPGQLIGYLLIDIERRQLSVRAFVERIEQSIIDTLAHYQLEAYSDRSAPGVYIDGVKIASLGLRVRQGFSMHGLSLNVDMDLAPFKRINPCGYPGMQVTQLKALTAVWQWHSLQQHLAQALCDNLAYEQLVPALNPLVLASPESSLAPRESAV